ALLIYDYIMTLDSEMILFWLPCRVNGASILFLLNRYICLAYQLFNFIPTPSSLKVSYCC
ncbi:hypothetical protein BD309DRAFT_871910, partial [Dichomitus squalens]